MLLGGLPESRCNTSKYKYDTARPPQRLHKSSELLGTEMKYGLPITSNDRGLRWAKLSVQIYESAAEGEWSGFRSSPKLDISALNLSSVSLASSNFISISSSCKINVNIVVYVHRECQNLPSCKSEMRCFSRKPGLQIERTRTLHNPQ